MGGKTSKDRVITHLRARFPGEWVYDGTFGHTWYHEDGWSIAAYVEWEFRVRGDVPWPVVRYRRTDTRAFVSGLPGDGTELIPLKLTTLKRRCNDIGYC